MSICLYGKTALLLWRRFDNRLLETPVFGHTYGAGPLLPRAFPSNYLMPDADVDSYSTDQDLLNRLRSSRWGIYFQGQAHVLVSRRKRGRAVPGLELHSVSAGLPKGAVICLDSGLSAISPEYCLVDQAASCDFVDWLLLAYEFCGCYAVSSDYPGGLRQRHPLCSSDSIKRLLDGLSNVKGRKDALASLRYLRDGSGSPRETALTLLLCLPQHYGGFGLPFPELNVSLNLGKGGRLLWGRKNAFDLVWADARMVIEYDGAAAHESFQARERDASRRDALIASGYRFFVVTRSQLASEDELYAIARALGGILGKRIRIRDKDFWAKHRDLRRRVLSFG